MTDAINTIKEGYRELFGKVSGEIIALPRSGSDRRYFRIADQPQTVIAAYNENPEENEAFIGFSEHFRKLGLPVPEIYGYIPQRSIYFLQDLGDRNLYTWLHERSDITDFLPDTISLYRKVLDTLIRFQTEGIKGLDLELCYPHKSFDRQSMMWDLNYFKYMLLKLLAVSFNERHLEKDFNTLADYLLETGQDYFLYRDFQTANVMVINGNPWFIDYQGGRKGAPQYDVASMLFDAKIPMSDKNREDLLAYYIGRFCTVTREDPAKFRQYYNGFSMIRLMQALGAFGFRGLYEKKPTFIESIVPGVRLLLKVADTAECHLEIPELYSAIRTIPKTPVFNQLAESKKTV